MPQQLPPEVIGIIVRYCQPRHSVLSSRIQLEREDVYKRLSQVNHTWRIYAKEEADQYLTIRIEEAWIPELGSDKTKYLSVTSETGDSFQVLPGDRYFSDDEEKSATGFFTVKVLQSVRNHLEEAYVPYINFQVLILLMKCNRLHTLHLDGVNFEEDLEGVDALLCSERRIGHKFKAHFQDLRHISLCDDSATELFEYLLNMEVCPFLISVNLKLFGGPDPFRFSGGQKSQIRFLSVWYALGSFQLGKEDSISHDLDQIDHLEKLLVSLTNLQHFAFCGLIMDLKSFLVKIPSKLRTLITTLQELDALANSRNVVEIPCSITAAQILSPLSRTGVAAGDTLLQSVTDWSRRHQLSFKVMPLEWSNNYAEVTAETINADMVKIKKRYGIVELRSRRVIDMEVIGELGREDANESGAAEDWFECWEQFRIQEFKF